MQISHVLVGQRRQLAVNGRAVTSGIDKTPVDAAEIKRVGVTGDAVVNTKHHGGPDQAVYLYGSIDYAWWRDAGVDVAPGRFGENLLIDDFTCVDRSIGDRIVIGSSVVLEITAPRIPCTTLGGRMKDPRFAHRFRAARRPGCYCRVIEQGVVRPDDSVHIEAYAGEPLGLLEVFDAAYEAHATIATLERILAAPIASRERAHKERQLAKARGE